MKLHNDINESGTAWTLPQLLNRMLSAGWQPYPEPGKWKHPDGAGALIDLDALMLDGRGYWHQLAERHELPPTCDDCEHGFGTGCPMGCN